MKYKDFYKFIENYPGDCMGNKYTVVWSCTNPSFTKINDEDEVNVSLTVLDSDRLADQRVMLHKISNDVYYLEKLLLTYFNKI